ncbi:hypothetical protein [Streptomyces sp. AC550_RSS872]|uniref:hypothetical protein n=1 Tax=Streptomyces sp. AC550_RSS872 TaxID=2823689 RepID=UPI0027E40B7E|nr:hypothetical protein [Streptomyces sp. AC550_RSS872]
MQREHDALTKGMHGSHPVSHEVYDAARAAREAGLEIPHDRPDGWGACGYRPGWELNWTTATAGQWNNPYSWTRADDGDFEL